MDREIRVRSRHAAIGPYDGKEIEDVLGRPGACAM